MALNIPDTLQEVVDRSRVDYANTVEDSDPFRPNSFNDGVITSNAGRSFECLTQVSIALRESLLFSAQTLPFILSHGRIRAITPNPATGSTGNIVIQGTPGSVIPAATEFQSSAGISYLTDSDKTINTIVTGITSMTSGSGVANVSTEIPHGLASGAEVTISGATQSEYNITTEIVVTAIDKFTFPLESNPPPATGTPIVTTDFASLVVNSQEVSTEDVSTNLPSGAELTIQTPIVGVGSNAFVDFNEIDGGNPEESTEDYKARVQFAIQNPVTQFNAAQVEIEAKKIPGTTRVFIFRITPEVGEATMYFIRGNDANIIPNPAQVAEMEAHLSELPTINMDPSWFHVLAPTPVTVNFNISNIVPDTPTMRNAIVNSLDQFFREDPVVGEDVTEDQYRCAILGTVDTETGDSLRSFSLSNPIGDIAIQPGELAVLGVVNIV